jgi:hypothetical protein
MYMNSVNTDNLRDLAYDALDQLQSATAPAIKGGKRQSGVMFDQSRELIDTVSTLASEAAGELGKSLVAYTKKNPLKALLLAVGVGALLVSAAKCMQSRR